MIVSNKSNRIYELDALRGIAALFVVLFHFTADRTDVHYYSRFGVTGVDLFFLISGFVILMTIERTKSWVDFVTNRFSRLYPTYWACVTLTTLALFFSQNFPGLSSSKILFDYLWNMTMFQSYLNQQDIDPSYWTLIVEMLFYIFMVLILVTGQLKRIELISFIAIIFISFYSSTYFQTHLTYLTIALRYHLPIVSHYPLFFAGILFYKMKFEKVTFIRYILLALCFLCQLSLFNIGGRAYFFLDIYQYAATLGVYFLIFILYISNKLGFIVNKVTVFLGTISYSLYLIHQSIGMKMIIPFFSKYTGYWKAHLLAITVVIFLSFLINKLVEKPAMEYIRNKRRSKALLSQSVVAS